MKIKNFKGKIKRIDLISNTLRIYTQSGDIVDMVLNRDQVKKIYQSILMTDLEGGQEDVISSIQNN